MLTLIGVITEEGEELPEKYLAMTPQSPVQPAPAPTPAQTSSTVPRRATKEDYDIALLGAGPGGYVAAIRAAQMGARVRPR